jgi:acyl carrier protein
MNIVDKIKKIIAENIDTDISIGNCTDLRKELEIDSFDVLMIMNAIDDEFSVSLEENDFQQIKTPEDIASLLKEKYGIL